MKNIIYIAGLPHSGSTILDLLIGSHPDCIGFGEIHFASKDDVKWTYCSCGNHWKNCEIWKDICVGMPKDKDMKYEHILKSLIIKNNDKHIIDSSKYLYPLQIINNVYHKNLNVILLTKDVRNWCNSISIIKNKQNINVPISNLYSKWEKDSKELLSFLKSENIKYTRIGYEELCFNTEKIKEIIADFIGLNKKLKWGVPSKSHVLFGNRMRVDKNKRSQIVYDYRWFNNQKVIEPFNTKFEALNNRFVYSNI